MVRQRVTVMVALVLAMFAFACTGGGEAAPSDAQIRGDIASSFDALNIHGITPSVKDGVVTLTGEVASQAEADRVVDVAKSAKGVVSVTSNITVAASTTPVIEAGNADSILTGKVQQRLLADTSLAGSNITPSVAGGVATLTGTVPTDAAKASAEKSAKSVEGVASVVNQLQVVAVAGDQAQLGDDQIEALVTALLDKQFPDLATFVQVSNGVVALSGAVPDQSTIVKVTKAVHGVSGVRAVDTRRLTIQGGEPEGQKLGSPTEKKKP